MADAGQAKMKRDKKKTRRKPLHWPSSTRTAGRPSSTAAARSAGHRARPAPTPATCQRSALRAQWSACRTANGPLGRAERTSGARGAIAQGAGAGDAASCDRSVPGAGVDPRNVAVADHRCAACSGVADAAPLPPAAPPSAAAASTSERTNTAWPCGAARSAHRRSCPCRQRKMFRRPRHLCPSQS